jgi:hypothetical protein
VSNKAQYSCPPTFTISRTLAMTFSLKNLSSVYDRSCDLFRIFIERIRADILLVVIFSAQRF